MLSVSNITIQFGAKRLFENVSFIVNPRDRTGLVGSNGTGKSTLLKVINGQIDPDSGEIALSKHTTIGYLPQDGVTFALPAEASAQAGGKTVYDEVYSG
ncbi:MAG TPA: ATP-binding cassette domain-containing protein, partial [Ignavibacteria bacterium]